MTEKELAELREAFNEYTASEGCGCCGNEKRHEAARERMNAILWPTQETLPALDMSGQPMGDPHPADLTRNGQCPVCGCTLGYHRWNCSLNQV